MLLPKDLSPNGYELEHCALREPRLAPWRLDANQTLVRFVAHPPSCDWWLPGVRYSNRLLRQLVAQPSNVVAERRLQTRG